MFDDYHLLLVILSVLIKNELLMKKKNIKPKTYKIKMPVYITFVKEQEKGFFENVTDIEMIKILKDKLSSSYLPYSSDNRNQTKKTVISKITPTEIEIGGVPALLLQIHAFNTNFYDGYFEGLEKIEINKDSKIGSDSNYILFYPRIVGLDNHKYTCYFLMLVYEDPTKSSGEVSHLAKIVANKILNVPIQNIKISMILEELKSIGDIPELHIKYYSLTESDNNIDVKYASYLDKTKLKKEEYRNFKNMPFNTMQELIADTSEDGNYQKKETRIIHGKNEYRISKSLIAEAGQELNDVAEKIFNASTEITESELEKSVHEKKFMIEKMSGVISNYISNDE